MGLVTYTYHPSYVRGINRRMEVKHIRDLVLKTSKAKVARGMAQVVESLNSKY
jgi:hypothetical protein